MIICSQVLLLFKQTTSLRERYQNSGVLTELEDAISTFRNANEYLPQDHPMKAACLNGLGNSLLRRFERLGDLADIDEAITAGRQAVCLIQDGHPDKPGCLSNLGISFRRQFERLGHLADLDEAITAQQRAVRLTPGSHPDKPRRLGNLGKSFHSRFERLGELDDLDEAIMALQQAVRLTLDSHPDKPAFLNALGTPLGCRFVRLGDLADLDEAIMVLQQAICLTPDGHPDKPADLNNLGFAHFSRFTRQPDDATLAQAIDMYSQSAKSLSGLPSLRFQAARQWASLCFAARSSNALDAYGTIADLLPLVVWLGRTVEQRDKDMSNIGNIGSIMADAVMTAIHFGKLELALEWMEQSRSIVWGQMLQLRTPLDELHQSHPDEANSLESISRSLDSTAVTYSKYSRPQIDGASRSLEEEAQARRRLAEEYEHALARIRSLPGFSEFLRPQKSESLSNVATSGPVIIINMHETRCDALILLPHSSCISHVPLPGLQPSVLRQMSQLEGSIRRADVIQRHYADNAINPESPNVLEWLWLYMAEPVLRYLKVSYSNPCHWLQVTDSAHTCSCSGNPRMVISPTSPASYIPSDPRCRTLRCKGPAEDIRLCCFFIYPHSCSPSERSARLK